MSSRKCSSIIILLPMNLTFWCSKLKLLLLQLLFVLFEMFVISATGFFIINLELLIFALIWLIIDYYLFLVWVIFSEVKTFQCDTLRSCCRLINVFLEIPFNPKHKTFLLSFTGPWSCYITFSFDKGNYSLEHCIYKLVHISQIFAFNYGTDLAGAARKCFFI